MTHPYPGAFTFLHGRKLFIWAGQAMAAPVAAVGGPGQVTAALPGEGLLVATGDGHFLITQAQWEGEPEFLGPVLATWEHLVGKIFVAANLQVCPQGDTVALEWVGAATQGRQSELRKPMKILILGVNGFIGNALTRRILTTRDWEVFGMDLYSNKLEESLDHPRFHFLEGDIAINKEWIEYHIKKCDVVLPLVAIATPMTYVKQPLRVFELDFEENLRIVRQCVKYGTRIIFPSTSEVYGMCPDAEFSEDDSHPGAGPHPQAALDLQLLQAAPGPGHLGLRPGRQPPVHPVPPLQLDRPQAGRPLRRQGRELPGGDPVHPQPPRAGAHQAGGRRLPEALLHLRRGRHRLPDDGSSKTRAAQATARSSTSATRTTKPR